MKPWKLLDTQYLVDAPWLKVAKERCELPNGKVIDDFYTLWQPDWVLILARTPKGNWVMTEQYRHGTGKIALEFPAGIIDKGESPEQAALRELREECGYSPVTEGKKPADEMSGVEMPAGEISGVEMPAVGTTYLGAFPVNPDRHRGKYHVVFIDNVVKNSTTHFDDSEDIESSEMSDEELQNKMADGTFCHPLQMAGYFKWKLAARNL